MSVVDDRLRALGLALPTASSPAGNYVPVVRVGNLVFVAGQLTRRDGQLEFVGKLGRELDVAAGQAAARLCALNILAQLKVACDGDLDRIVRCVRLTAYVNCTPDFDAQPQVANGASDLLVAVLGDAGRHVRTAVGANSLPGGVACEIESTFEVRP